MPVSCFSTVVLNYQFLAVLVKSCICITLVAIMVINTIIIPGGIIPMSRQMCVPLISGLFLDKFKWKNGITVELLVRYWWLIRVHSHLRFTRH